MLRSLKLRTLFLAMVGLHFTQKISILVVDPWPPTDGVIRCEDMTMISRHHCQATSEPSSILIGAPLHLPSAWLLPRSNRPFLSERGVVGAFYDVILGVSTCSSSRVE